MYSCLLAILNKSTYNTFMTNPIQKIFVVGFAILGLANFSVSMLTLIIKAQKYGLSDLWLNPDSFAIGTLIMALVCFGAAYWFFHKKAISK